MDQKLSPFCSPQMSEPGPMGEAMGKLSVLSKMKQLSGKVMLPLLEEHSRGQLSGLPRGVDRGQLLEPEKSEFRSFSFF